jgi:DNA-binding protein H-NS
VRKPVEAKYRHPENAELTWTGRGRKPVWVQELLTAGKTLEDLAI